MTKKEDGESKAKNKEKDVAVVQNRQKRRLLKQT